MDAQSERPRESKSWLDTMLSHANILAARLASGRYARPIVFVSDLPSDLRTTIAWVGEELSYQGHHIISIDDPSTAGALVSNALECASDTTRPPRAVIMLVPAINDLDRASLAGWMDVLHFAARGSHPLGSIAHGTSDFLGPLGSLRSFAEMLIEFKRVPHSFLQPPNGNKQGQPTT